MSDIWESILDGNLLMALFQIIMGVLSIIVSIILLPFGVLIETFIPDLNAGLSSVSQIYVYVSTYLAWIIDALGIPAAAIIIIASYYIFSFSVTFAAWTIKLVIKWKTALW